MTREGGGRCRSSEPGGRGGRRRGGEKKSGRETREETRAESLRVTPVTRGSRKARAARKNHPRRTTRRSAPRTFGATRRAVATRGRLGRRVTHLGAAEAEAALELGVDHAAAAGDVLLVVRDVLVHALPAGHLHLDAVALVELGRGGAELVAGDAAGRLREERGGEDRRSVRFEVAAPHAARSPSPLDPFGVDKGPASARKRLSRFPLARSRAADARATRTLATGAMIELMVTADMITWCVERSVRRHAGCSGALPGRRRNLLHKGTFRLSHPLQTHLTASERGEG